MHICMALNWDDLRVFLAVSREGSLTAAGRRLGLDQSTVGRRLTALEDEIEAQLFVRRPQGMSLTAAGRRLREHAEAIAEHALAAERAVTGERAELSGLVRLTAPTTFGARIVVPILAEFRRAHPQIDIELIAENRTLSLAQREADLALRLDRPDEPSLIARSVATVASSLYASQDYLRVHGEANLPGLSGHAVIGYAGSFRPSVESKLLARHARNARVVLAASSLEAQLEAVRCGVGIAVLPCYLADKEKQLRRLLPPSQAGLRQLWSILHRDSRSVARVRVLADLLARRLKQLAPILVPTGT
jgi:DNA-binding transcriptional LysR family regulator